MTLPATGSELVRTDCIGRATRIPVSGKRAVVQLDGAASLFTGLSQGALRRTASRGR